MWAFEQVTARIEQTLRRPREGIERDKLEQQCERMIQFYAGPFLGNEPDEPWILPMRERQHQRFVRATVEACRYWQQAGQPEKAVALLERALEADSVAENLYRHLMLGYAQLGRQSDAAETYNRCRNALAAALKVEPSAETRALYEKILLPS